MGTVIVVGAGASCAQASSLRPRQQLRHPPLDTTFFRKIRQLEARESPLSGVARQFREAIEEAGGVDPFADGRISLEQYFADVYYEAAVPGRSLAFALYVALLRTYNRTIAATTDWMSAGRRGAVDRLIAAEREEGESLTLITFNQDLVLENALHRLYPDRWCLQHLYNDDEFVEAPVTRADGFPLHHPPECVHGVDVHLLKLHGSLNWGLQVRDRVPSRSGLFPRGAATVYLTNARTCAAEGSLRRDGRGRSQWYWWPLIVPPIYDKSKIVGMAKLRRAWESAERAIGSATRLLLFGYSLPDADVEARQLLRKAFLANSHLAAVDCINPDCSIAVKLKERLRARIIRVYESVDAYLQQGS